MGIQFKEIDIEDFIWQSIPSGSLQQRGFPLPNALYYRQVNIPGCGIIDIAAVRLHKHVAENINDKAVCIHIYELKRGTINCAHVGQLMRYVDAIQANASEILAHFGFPAHYDVRVYGILIGAGIERDAFHLLHQLCIFNCSAYLFSFNLEHGIIFENLEEIEDHYNIQLTELPRPKFRKLARASYPIIYNRRPKRIAQNAGQPVSDDGISEINF